MLSQLKISQFHIFIIIFTDISHITRSCTKQFTLLFGASTDLILVPAGYFSQDLSDRVLALRHRSRVVKTGHVFGPVFLVVRVDYQQYPMGLSLPPEGPRRSVDKREGVKKKKSERLLNYARSKRVEWRLGGMGYAIREGVVANGAEIGGEGRWMGQPLVTTAQVPINKFAFGMNEWHPFRASLVNSSDCCWRVRGRFGGLVSLVCMNYSKKRILKAHTHTSIHGYMLHGTQGYSRSILFMCRRAQLTWYGWWNGSSSRPWVIGSFYCCLVCFNFAFWLWLGDFFSVYFLFFCIPIPPSVMLMKQILMNNVRTHAWNKIFMAPP